MITGGLGPAATTAARASSSRAIALGGVGLWGRAAGTVRPSTSRAIAGGGGLWGKAAGN